ncbi:MAG: hypothetical protein JXA30_17205 [Deltaproteobacteria bacterium]|nr:hypothetical protein [Deltaproteobacteria bacterium]
MKQKATIYLLFLLIAMASLPAGAQESQETTAQPRQEEKSNPSGYFRVDTDILSTQLWAAATYDLGSGIGLASDIYVVGTFAELDLGVAFSIGPVSLLPMAGIGFEFGEGDDDAPTEPQVASLIAPQLFTIVDSSWLYFESWIQIFFNEVFIDGATDSFYTRNFLLVKTFDFIAIGPQVEITYEFNNAAGDELASLPLGGRVNVGYGENNTLGLFLGYDLKAEQLAGRFTFIRIW